MCSVRRLQLCFKRFEAVLLKWIGVQEFGQGLAFDLSPTAANNSQLDDKGNDWSLTDIMNDGFLWHTPPKHRRSRERRLTRKFGETYIKQWATPKKNIVTCLECGHYHEQGVVCGNCYAKVREETQAMMDAIDQDRLKYDVPRTEVVYLYDDEKDNRPKYQGKYIVEMDKPRPKWFSDALMKKVTPK